MHEFLYNIRACYIMESENKDFGLHHKIGQSTFLWLHRGLLPGKVENQIHSIMLLCWSAGAAITVLLLSITKVP